MAKRKIREARAKIRAAKESHAPVLDLRGMHLESLPPEVGELTELTYLDLERNQLTVLPPEIGKLTELSFLSVWGNQLTALPPEIGKLTKLTHLLLQRNQLTGLPPEIGNLTKLTGLHLSRNQLTALPPEIGELTELSRLHLYRNQLTTLPPEIGKLTELSHLYLYYNQLTALPPEIGKLTNLRGLYVWGNQLTAVPREIGKLTKLTDLDLAPNPLESPPPEIVRRGTKAVLAFLREQIEAEGVRQWVSKLLLVGEGGVGKTSLLGRLMGQRFDEDESATRGVEIRPMELAHPTEDAVTMQLRSWDFGGQQIYHATHQFFLSNRSLFVLVWNARLGWEQGKLRKWLDQIDAKAPDSPILVVATHIDECPADLPKTDLKREYPQIAGFHSVSNKTGKGVKAFRAALAVAAAELSLMGETWPTTWRRAADAVREREESHVEPGVLDEILEANGVRGESKGVLTQWLHDLGEILFFRDNPELDDEVFLDPNWVIDRIYRVLTCEDVESGTGIFRREHMKSVWPDLGKGMREHLLRLMEQFDLSYRTLEDRDISIVVERLGLDPPDYEARWRAKRDEPRCRQVAMKFQLKMIPAGIPTWFIARSHRFTTGTHWLYGALLRDETHLALLRAYPGESEKYLELTVRGPWPHNFFAVLRDGLELTLRRFPGLDIKRLIPCPGHDGGPCGHEFNLTHVLNAYHRGRATLECPESLDTVSVPMLLFGLDIAAQPSIDEKLDELLAGQRVLADSERERFEAIQSEMHELAALSQRNFTFQFNAAQSAIDSACPRIFSLVPAARRAWTAKLLGQKATLHLHCEEPGCWHLIEGANYDFKINANWLRAVAPYVSKLVGALKYAALLVAPAAGLAAAPVADALKHHIKMMEELAKKLPDIKDAPADEYAETLRFTDDPDRAAGEGFRALRDLLKRLDPSGHWGGLKKTLTPEGHYLWLCDRHAVQYRR